MVGARAVLTDADAEHEGCTSTAAAPISAAVRSGLTATKNLSLGSSIVSYQVWLQLSL